MADDPPKSIFTREGLKQAQDRAAADDAADRQTYGARDGESTRHAETRYYADRQSEYETQQKQDLHEPQNRSLDQARADRYGKDETLLEQGICQEVDQSVAQGQSREDAYSQALRDHGYDQMNRFDCAPANWGEQPDHGVRSSSNTNQTQTSRNAPKGWHH